MIRSMTGYGQATTSVDGISIVAKTKSLNARFLDLRINLPEVLSDLESEIASSAKKYSSRGTITIQVELITNNKMILYEVFLDEALLSKYISSMKKSLNLDISLTPRDIVSLPDVLSTRLKKDTLEKLRKPVINTVNEAFSRLIDMRSTEGSSMYDDFVIRLDKISAVVEILEQRKDKCKERFIGVIKERVCEILKAQVEISEDRILQEAAILSSKADPTEELIRLKSHVNQFKDVLLEDKSVGSKLKFLLQECNREADTIGSKGADLETSNSVIIVKEELERIREQISNVE
ncbi:YicC family protein [bacterium]|nr:YicC family protein [bacterium]